MTIEQLSQAIKEKIRQSAALMSIFKDFEVDPQRLDDLQIIVTDLDKKYAETDARTMKLNKSLFESGNFFEDSFLIVAHEIVHWLSRIKEEDAYFNDPEETLGFVASIAYEIGEGAHPDEIYNKIWPKISWHFHNDLDAREFYGNMLEKAMKIIAGIS